MPVATLEKPKEEIEESFEESPEEVLAGLPSDEKIEAQIEEAGARERVFPLDPDFILILFFAILLDALDIVIFILGSLDFFTISTLASWAIDIFVFIIICGWMNWRMGKIAESKRNRQIAIQKSIQKALTKLGKLRKIGKVSDKVFERYMRRFGERMGKIGRLVARTARRPFMRALIRGAIAFLGEFMSFIGLIPFWTISVILMLREK